MLYLKSVPFPSNLQESLYSASEHCWTQQNSFSWRHSRNYLFQVMKETWLVYLLCKRQPVTKVLAEVVKIRAEFQTPWLGDFSNWALSSGSCLLYPITWENSMRMYVLLYKTFFFFALSLGKKARITCINQIMLSSCQLEPFTVFSEPSCDLYPGGVLLEAWWQWVL